MRAADLVGNKKMSLQLRSEVVFAMLVKLYDLSVALRASLFCCTHFFSHNTLINCAIKYNAAKISRALPAGLISFISVTPLFR